MGNAIVSQFAYFSLSRTEGLAIAGRDCGRDLSHLRASKDARRQGCFGRVQPLAKQQWVGCRERLQLQDTLRVDRDAEGWQLDSRGNLLSDTSFGVRQQRQRKYRDHGIDIPSHDLQSSDLRASFRIKI